MTYYVVKFRAATGRLGRIDWQHSVEHDTEERARRFIERITTGDLSATADPRNGHKNVHDVHLFRCEEVK